MIEVHLRFQQRRGNRKISAIDVVDEDRNDQENEYAPLETIHAGLSQAFSLFTEPLAQASEDFR